MCLSYGIEPVDKLLADGLHYLTVKHWAEVETGAFDPDWDAVREAENSERMRWFTVRLDGELIGYASVLMVKSLQQKGKEYAVIEDLFVDKEHRKTGAALGLLRFTIRLLKTLNVSSIMVGEPHKKEKRDLGVLYKRLGFRRLETIWEMRT